MLKQDKAALIDSEKEKDIPTWVDESREDCVDSLSLGKKMTLAQGPFLCGIMGAGRLHTWDCLSEQGHGKSSEFHDYVLIATFILPWSASLDQKQYWGNTMMVEKAGKNKMLPLLW